MNIEKNIEKLVAAAAKALRIQDWKYIVFLVDSFPDDPDKQGEARIVDADNKSVEIRILTPPDPLTILHEIVHIRFDYLLDTQVNAAIKVMYDEANEIAINAVSEAIAMIPSVKRQVDKFKGLDKK